MITQLVVCQITTISKIATDLSKQQALDANPKAIQIIFFGNLNDNNNRLMFFIIEVAKETISDFSQGTVKVL